MASGEHSARWGPHPLMRLKPVQYLGDISYSIYLYQQIVPGPVMRGLAHYPAVVQLTVSFTIIVLLASGSYYFIERPFLRLKERFEPRRREAPLTAVSQPVGV